MSPHCCDAARAIGVRVVGSTVDIFDAPAHFFAALRFFASTAGRLFASLQRSAVAGLRAAQRACAT